MDFEFDREKSHSNKQKHGIDFIEAQVIWEHPEALEAPIEYYGEFRFQIIGKAYEKIWTAVITYREETTRIISVRRARNYEVQFYES